MNRDSLTQVWARLANEWREMLTVDKFIMSESPLASVSNSQMSQNLDCLDQTLGLRNVLIISNRIVIYLCHISYLPSLDNGHNRALWELPIYLLFLDPSLTLTVF